MARIARHPIDLEDAKEALRYSSDELNHSLEQMPKGLAHASGLCDMAEEYLGYLAALEPTSPEMCRALRTGSQSMAALFLGATASKPEIQVRLDGSLVTIPSKAPESSTHVGNWLRGFFLAATCRERTLVDILCEVPMTLLRASPSEADEFQHLYASSLQSFWRRESDAPEHLAAALEAAHPDRLEVADEDYVLSVATPQMELLYHLLLQDAAAFNKSLVKALEEHKKYWSQKKDRRNREASAFVAIGPTALASFAHEAGIPIEVESDYLPVQLVKGECHPD